MSGTVSESLREALLVTLVGAVAAFGANAARTGGLSVGRDYFPRGVVTADEAAPHDDGATHEASSTLDDDPDGDLASAAGDIGSAEAEDPVDPVPDPGVDESPGTAAEAPTDTADVDPALVARLAEKGLSAIGHRAFVTLTEDPMMAAGAYLIVDARRAEDFSAGHIPGALHLDPFFPDEGLPALMPLLPIAQRVVVYCNGGECEDSETAALMLMQFGVPSDRLAVYTGGIAAWRADERPEEQG